MKLTILLSEKEDVSLYLRAAGLGNYVDYVRQLCVPNGMQLFICYTAYAIGKIIIMRKQRISHYNST